MTFQDALEHVAQLFEAIGALVLIGGLVVSSALAVRSWTREHDGVAAYQLLRARFGGVILLGLEILVAADLIRTVAVSPTLQNVAILGVIVLIRTFLSFSLEIEIGGCFPGVTGSPLMPAASAGHRSAEERWNLWTGLDSPTAG